MQTYFCVPKAPGFVLAGSLPSEITRLQANHKLFHTLVTLTRKSPNFDAQSCPTVPWSKCGLDNPGRIYSAVHHFYNCQSRFSTWPETYPISTASLILGSCQLVCEQQSTSQRGCLVLVDEPVAFVNLGADLRSRSDQSCDRSISHMPMVYTAICLDVLHLPLIELVSEDSIEGHMAHVVLQVTNYTL